MSEVDWWLCDQCQSLNNLSARRCYSCRRRKPRRTQTASRYLGYTPVVRWDGRVSFALPAWHPGQPGLDRSTVEAAKATPSAPPPLREPVPRSIVEVAPPVPHGSRITYWLGDPVLDPRRAGPTPQPLRRVVAVPIATDAPAPGLLSSAPPVAPGPPPDMRPGPPSLPPGPPGLPPVPPPPVAPRRVVAVPVVSDALPHPSLPPGPPSDPSLPPGAPSLSPGAPPQAAVAAASFPHWRDLLDVPTPDSARLRRAFAESPARRAPAQVWTRSNGTPADAAATESTEPSAGVGPGSAAVAVEAVGIGVARFDPGGSADRRAAARPAEDVVRADRDRRSAAGDPPWPAEDLGRGRDGRAPG